MSSLPRCLLTFLFCASFFAASVVAKPATYRISNTHAKRQVVFYSKAPVENFEGVATEINGSVSVDFSKPNLNLSGQLSVPVRYLQTGITMRDVHMRNKYWLNADRYQEIRFELSDPKKHKVKKKGANKWFAEVEGRFTLKSVTKTIRVPVTITKKDSKKGEMVHIKGGFPVKLKDYGIRGPMAMEMIGAKVGETIKISLKLVGKKMKSFGKPKRSTW